MMNRRTFSAALIGGAAVSMIPTRGPAANSPPIVARNVVLVHGLFSDGSCWSEVIPRLLENLTVPCKAILGPWRHGYPAPCAPGPGRGHWRPRS